jgi:hypothetical protein
MAINKSKKHTKSKVNRKKIMKKTRKRVSKMKGGHRFGECGDVNTTQEADIKGYFQRNRKLSLSHENRLSYYQKTECLSMLNRMFPEPVYENSANQYQ